MDTSAAGALCDAIGVGVPLVAAPMVNNRLWGHQVRPSTLRTLSGAGFAPSTRGSAGSATRRQSGREPAGTSSPRSTRDGSLPLSSEPDCSVRVNNGKSSDVGARSIAEPA